MEREIQETPEIEDARNQIVCMITNTPEKFVDALQQITIRAALFKLDRMVSIPLKNLTKLKFDNDATVLNNLLEITRGEKRFFEPR